MVKKLPTIRIAGKEYKYHNATDLSHKAGITTAAAKSAISAVSSDEAKEKLDDLNDTRDVMINAQKETRGKNVEIPDYMYVKFTKNDLDTRIAYNDDGTKMIKYSIASNDIPLLRREFSLKKNTPSSYQYTAPKYVNVQGKMNVLKEIDDPDYEVNSMIDLYMQLNFGSEIVYRVTQFYYRGKLSGLENAAIDKKIEYYDDGDDAHNKIVKIVLIGNGEPIFFDWENMVLRDTNYVLSQWKNIEYLDDSSKACSVKYLRIYFGIKIREEVDVEGLCKICAENSINYIFYSLDGKVRCKSVSRKNAKIATAILYNNHIYPLKGKKPIPVDKVIKKIEQTKTVGPDLISLLDKNIIPYDISFSVGGKNTHNITSFTHEGIKYLENRNYDGLYKILEMFGLESKIFDSIQIADVGNIIADKYIKISNESFLPINVSKGGFLYDIINDEDDLNSPDIQYIDKAKCYTSVLKNLKYNIKVDWRTAKVKTINKKAIDVEICCTNLYVVDTQHNFDILYPSNGYYDGGFILDTLKYRPDIVIVEELVCQTTVNYYSKLITDLYSNDLDRLDVKLIVNALIGKFQKNTIVSESYKYNGIYNEDESKRTEGLKIAAGKHKIVFDIIKSVKFVLNRKPICIQVKDGARLLIFEQMLKLGLKASDILQIKTDSILFKGTNPLLSHDEIDGWRKLDKADIKRVNVSPITDDSVPTFFIKNQMTTKRVLHNQYAGAGKTYYIINTLIPSLGSESYVIFTPSHCSLKEYRNAGLKCDVIQKYDYTNDIPPETTIIIDEVGMVGRGGHNFLYKLMMLGKNYYCFGDFKQLVPPDMDNPMDSEHYLNFMFSNIVNNFTNHRNNFTKEYYDSLIESKDKEYLIREVKKYSSTTYDNSVVLCYRNDKTRDPWNKKIMAEKGLCYESIGLQLYCEVTNEKYRSYGIYKGFPVYIHSVDNGRWTIVNNMDNPEIRIECTEKQITNDFSPRFALNCYNIQGQSIDSYYWAAEDDFFINGRTAYTIISRLKGNIMK